MSSKKIIQCTMALVLIHHASIGYAQEKSWWPFAKSTNDAPAKQVQTLNGDIAITIEKEEEVPNRYEVIPPRTATMEAPPSSYNKQIVPTYVPPPQQIPAQQIPAQQLVAPQQPYPSQSKNNQAIIPDIKTTPPAMVSNTNLPLVNVKPSAIKKHKLFFMRAGDQSAVTGQLTCDGFNRATQLPWALKPYGEFNTIITSSILPDTINDITFDNTAALATALPAASKWNIPTWSVSPYATPRTTLEALYNTIHTSEGSTNILIVWDVRWLVTVEHALLDGILRTRNIQQSEIDKKRKEILPWKRSELNRIDTMTFTVKDNAITGIDWTSTTLKIKAGGCS